MCLERRECFMLTVNSWLKSEHRQGLHTPPTVGQMESWRYNG
jgi:hypothetical protein